MAADGLLLSVALYTQQVLRFSATGFGLVLALMTGCSVVASYASQLFVARACGRWPPSARADPRRRAC